MGIEWENITKDTSNRIIMKKINFFIKTGSPIYSLAYNSRRQQILAGQNKKVRLFQLITDENLKVNNDVLEKKTVTATDHSDIVNCLVSCEGRFYSAG
jgi:hypothetical protein